MYKVSEKEMRDLKEYLVSKNVNNLNFSGKEAGFAQILKALIGRNLFDKDAYYPILYQNDNAVLKAIETLH